MAFVKLDCGILNSTLWVEKDSRDIFITALLMSVPHELFKPTPQIEIRSLSKTGFVVPPGWYGLVQSASVGIIRHAMMDQETGLDALEKLGSPEQTSRSSDFEGRRLVRVDGGFIVLNFQKYRDKDHGAAERMRRFRMRQRDSLVTELTEPQVTRNLSNVTRKVTQAEAEAEAEAEAVKDKSIVGQPPNEAPHDKKNDCQSKTLQAIEILEFLNTKTGKKFRGLDSNGKHTATLRLIIDRLKTGVTVQDCKTMIARKYRDWSNDDKMHIYLRPSTLFRASNFENYLGECVAK